MKMLLKIFISIIDILLMPIRAILVLEVYVTAAIVSDMDIKEMVKAWLEEIKQYPSLLKTSLKILFWN
nr:MAG TPA: hypothetical protein [Caudoviricetes sp.]